MVDKNKVKDIYFRYVKFFEKPDIFDVATYFFIIFFFIAIFQNITLLVSPDETARNNAIILLGVASLGIAGLGLKAIFDNAKIKIGNIVIQRQLTTTVYEEINRKNLANIVNSLLWFAVNFGSTSLIGYFIFNVPFSQFGVWSQYFTFAVISAVSEELFFTYALLPILISELGIIGVFINIAVFTMYHTLVYKQIELLVYVALSRAVYNITYLFHRRQTPSILAHFLNNLLTAVRFGG